MKNKNKKIPVLMYHELIADVELKDSTHKMTPSYFISKDTFSLHLDVINKNKYRTLLFEEMSAIDLNGNNIFLTFDDGWLGNHDYALPILKANNCKGTFFVTAEFIGKAGYMDWDNLNELVEQGMSVQSHCLTHRPLQTLKKEEIYNELSGSKKHLEDRLGRAVNAISFPHGSYNSEIIKTAFEVGYEVMCTSDYKINNPSLFLRPLILGRINVTSNISPLQFNRLISHDFREITKIIIFRRIRLLFKRLIGIENYTAGIMG